MLEEQFERLDELQTKLFDAVLAEADPANWPASEKAVKDMSKDDRGDRYWCKKNAAATFTLINKIFSLNVFRHQNSRLDAMSTTPEQEFDEQIQKAESEAMKQLEAFQKRKNIKLVT